MRAIYNSEDGRWYRDGETPWVVRNVPVGCKLVPFFNVKSDAYGEAFEKLYAQPMAVNYQAIVREQRHGD